MTKSDAQEADAPNDGSRTTLFDHLWWIVEVVGVVVCLIVWFMTRDVTCLLYAIVAVFILVLAFRLSRYASDSSRKTTRRT